MSNPALQEDQLLELLLQLKKTTPEQARTILNSQPQIAYALMAVMVNINALDMDVVHKTLSAYGALPEAAPAPATSVLPSTSASAIPPHLTQQHPHRGGTPTYPPQPPSSAYPPQSYPTPDPSMNMYGAPPQPTLQIPGFGGYPQHPQPAPAPAMLPPGLPSALANIPDEQKALIMRVMSMTREEVYQMPPAERENIIKLRATLGLPT